jgi:metal-sulfur cluster biosynthetic enzyme
MPSIDDIFIELSKVYDPELMVDIVDLGLVYDVQVTGKTIKVEMTLTSPGCPMGPQLRHEVTERLKIFDDVKKVDVAIVWNPPWHPDLMSEEAKLELGYAI